MATHEMLQCINNGHMGITKCHRQAADSVWWPNIFQEIKTMVEDCRQCLERRHQRAEPMKMTELPSGPWLFLGMDIFEFGKKKYIIIQYYSSTFFEVIMLLNTTSATINSCIKNSFARHGIPEVVHTDGGPQLISAKFSQFAKDYGFAVSTSRHKFEQSNGQAENPIKTDNYFASSPYSTTDAWPNHHLEGFRAKNRRLKERNKLNFDQRPGANALLELGVGSRVWIPGLELIPFPRSYIIQTAQGKIRRNRIQLIPAPHSQSKGQGGGHWGRVGEKDCTQDNYMSGIHQNRKTEIEEM
ncbi:hypothetical protein PR048_031726 [Dryococelus australis]|uniref:RNA-directed DNA polymerase n=1 Tax=Dryococelus australis TaxID=614101 RepID=A0ABQ9G731_9NEOP|nr:hypothetical protein PR048_031726 [Dryococelus australis]